MSPSDSQELFAQLQSQKFTSAQTYMPFFEILRLGTLAHLDPEVSKSESRSDLMDALLYFWSWGTSSLHRAYSYSVLTKRLGFPASEDIRTSGPRQNVALRISGSAMLRLHIRIRILQSRIERSSAPPSRRKSYEVTRGLKTLVPERYSRT